MHKNARIIIRFSIRQASGTFIRIEILRTRICTFCLFLFVSIAKCLIVS